MANGTVPCAGSTRVATLFFSVPTTESASRTRCLRSRPTFGPVTRDHRPAEGGLAGRHRKLAGVRPGRHPWRPLRQWRASPSGGRPMPHHPRDLPPAPASAGRCAGRGSCGATMPYPAGGPRKAMIDRVGESACPAWARPWRRPATSRSRECRSVWPASSPLRRSSLMGCGAPGPAKGHRPYCSSAVWRTARLGACSRHVRSHGLPWPAGKAGAWPEGPAAGHVPDSWRRPTVLRASARKG